MHSPDSTSDAPASLTRSAHPPTAATRLTLALLIGLTLLAACLRLPGLRGPDGQLNTDEARLTLAADGVLQHGYPVMPSGRVYTRGLLNSYLIAGSFALFGRHDFAARLPSVLAGALLVPVVFLLGRAFGDGGRRQSDLAADGTLVGLVAAAFAALAEPLVYYATSAWLPSVFLLLLTGACYCCYRGFIGGRRGWQVAGALAFCAALLSYEFAVLLLVALCGALLCQVLRGDWSWYRGRSTLLALALLLAGLPLLLGLALALRSGTMAGASGEIQTFFSPSLNLRGIGYYWRFLLIDYLPLVAVVVLALPLLAREQPRGVLFLVLLALLFFLVPSLLIQFQRSPRYALPMLPFLAILAAGSVVRLARWLTSQLGLQPRLGREVAVVGALLVFGIALHGDLRSDLRQIQAPPPGPTWLQAIQREDLAPNSLILAESANKAHYYLGRADFYIRPEDYNRYAYQADESPRYLYTGATLLLGPGDFERLVEVPNPGRTLWIVGRADRLPSRFTAVDPRLWGSLLRSADRTAETADGWLLVKVPLPRRAPS